MTGKIFLSYRRDDASGDARSIYQRLRTAFGRDRLFIDVDTIELGRDFRSALESNLADCGVLIAVIGPNWLFARDDNGVRRLDKEEDFVRLEIAKALEKDIVVIPVLVSGAALPKVEQLPAELRGLVFRQAASVRHETFPQDMAALERDIRRHLGYQKQWLWPFAASLAVIAGLFFTDFLWVPVLDNVAQGLGLSTNFARDRDIASVMARCVKNPPHPEKSEIVHDIAERLRKVDHEYGWIADAAKSATQGEKTWKRITSITASPDELRINYDWRNGRLRLVPVVQRRYSTRGSTPPEADSRSATRSSGSVWSREHKSVESVLQGAWSQNNGYGCIEMIFDDAGTAIARWGVATSNTYDAEAYVRKSPQPNWTY